MYSVLNTSDMFNILMLVNILIVVNVFNVRCLPYYKVNCIL